MNTAITKRQLEVLEAIVGFIDVRRFSPSYEEIAEMVNLSSLATVHRLVTTLREKGFIATKRNQARSIVVTGKARRTFIISDYRRGYERGYAEAAIAKATGIAAPEAAK